MPHNYFGPWPAKSKRTNDDVPLDCYKNLAAAIVEHACADYKDILRSIMRNRMALAYARTDMQAAQITTRIKNADYRRLKLESFFKSEWFDTLVCLKIDGEEAINTMRKQVHYIPDM